MQTDKYLVFILKVVAAREEEMQRRRDKFAKMEEDREKIRQGIREKVIKSMYLIL